MSAVDAVALRMSALTVEEITREISDRCDHAHQLDGPARAEALQFNALLVTALWDLGIWPKRGRGRASAFGPVESRRQ